MSNSRWRAVVISVAAVLALSTTADAQQGRKGKPRQVPDTGVEEQTLQTPETIAGELLLLQLTDRSSEGLVEVEHPNGAVSIDLQGRFQSIMLAATDTNGKAAATCYSNHDGLKAAAHAHPLTVVAPSKPSVTPVREIK